MLSLDTVKEYLRVDTDTDDALIQLEMEAAKQYMVGAVTDFTSRYPEEAGFASAADTAMLAIIAQLYEDRTSERSGDYSYTVRSLINQLNLWEG